MSQYRNIFLMAEPDMRRTPAFEEAIGLARTTGARLHICVFAYSAAIGTILAFDRDAGRQATENFVNRHKVWLASEANALRGEGLQVTTDAVWARPQLDEMLAQIMELSPDLVIKGVHHEPLLKRLLFTPLEWQLLQLCPAPLLLVGGSVPRTPRRVLVAIDPTRYEDDGQESAFNERIINAGIALAIQCQADLHLAHAMFPPVVDYAPPAAALPLSGDFYQQILAGQQQQFDDFADAHGVPAERRHFLIGAPGREIPALAAEIGADTIVLGSVHRTGIERLLMGSTAQTILQHAPCNVLAVKPARFAEESRRWLSDRRRQDSH